MIAAASPCPACGGPGLDQAPLDVAAVASGASVALLTATCRACGWHYTPAPARRLHRIVCDEWAAVDAGATADEIEERIAALCYSFGWQSENPSPAPVLPCEP